MLFSVQKVIAAFWPRSHDPTSRIQSSVCLSTVDRQNTSCLELTITGGVMVGSGVCFRFTMTGPFSSYIMGNISLHWRYVYYDNAEFIRVIKYRSDTKLKWFIWRFWSGLKNPDQTFFNLLLCFFLPYVTFGLYGDGHVNFKTYNGICPRQKGSWFN